MLRNQQALLLQNRNRMMMQHGAVQQTNPLAGLSTPASPQTTGNNVMNNMMNGMAIGNMGNSGNLAAEMQMNPQYRELVQRRQLAFLQQQQQQQQQQNAAMQAQLQQQQLQHRMQMMQQQLPPQAPTGNQIQNATTPQIGRIASQSQTGSSSSQPSTPGPSNVGSPKSVSGGKRKNAAASHANASVDRNTTSVVSIPSSPAPLNHLSQSNESNAATQLQNHQTVAFQQQQQQAQQQAQMQQMLRQHLQNAPTSGIGMPIGLTAEQQKVFIAQQQFILNQQKMMLMKNQEMAIQVQQRQQAQQQQQQAQLTVSTFDFREFDLFIIIFFALTNITNVFIINIYIIIEIAKYECDRCWKF